MLIDMLYLHFLFDDLLKNVFENKKINFLNNKNIILLNNNVNREKIKNIIIKKYIK